MPIEQFLTTAADQFAADFSTLLSPFRAVSNHVRAILLELEVSSRMHLGTNKNRAEIYDRFGTLKKYYKMVSDRDGIYVYYFLCSIESRTPDIGVKQNVRFLPQNASRME